MEYRHLCAKKVHRVCVFLSLFTFVFFLESIGGTYMISAVQNIERQFQIPSKLSGLLFSAHDISYIPAVIVVSYLGSRGNRAKWIGAGCTLIALAHVFTASPNFFFSAHRPTLNTSQVESHLRIDENLPQSNASIADLFENPTALISSQNQSADNLGGFRERDVVALRRAATAAFSFCNRNVNELKQTIRDSECRDQPSNVKPLLIMFFALLALGIGKTVPFTLGLPLIDDNIGSHSMPVYFAFMASIRILGPICGFLIGSAANSFYYTFPNPAPKGLTLQDPTWIGAWWMGFLFIGTVSIVPSVALYFFPESSGSEKNRRSANDKIHSHANEKEAEGKRAPKKLALFDRHVGQSGRRRSTSTKGGFKKFVSSYAEILRSKVYVGGVVGRIFDVMALKGYMVFFPKYLENHFGIPQYKVQLYMATLGVAGSALGIVCGGFITRRLKLNGRSAAFYVFAMTAINVALFFSKNFIACESIVNGLGRVGIATNFNYTTACNSDCYCDSARLFPVCDAEGKAFYSPCHAGCRRVAGIDARPDDLAFTDCACVPNGEVVKREFCRDRDDCWRMIPAFFVTVVVGAFASGTAVVPAMLIILRCQALPLSTMLLAQRSEFRSVPKSKRSPALGLQAMVISIGTMFSPIIWGSVIDSACRLWDNACDGSSKSCLIYDPAMLRVKMHNLYVAIRLISLLMDIYVMYHAKGLRLQEEEEKGTLVKIEDAEKVTAQESIRMNVID